MQNTCGDCCVEKVNAKSEQRSSFILVLDTYIHVSFETLFLHAPRPLLAIKPCTVFAHFRVALEF